MNGPSTPSHSLPDTVIWDLTYACPLRCSHCYSESGRRPSRQMSFDDMRRVADVLVRMRLRRVLFSGGEPLLVQGLPQLAEQLVQGGISVSLYSSGWLLTEAWLPDLLRLFSSIHISLDGATAEVHDAIRGRKGSFERALRALSLLDVASGLPRSPHGRTLNFGIDCVVLQSNFHQLEAFCSEIVPLFPSLQFLNLGAGVPTGLASREGFDELELINEEQLERMRDPRFAAHLRSLAPGLGERLHITDNFALLMDPESLRNGTATTSVLQLEPDGQVRAMAIYEGTIGHILREPPEVLWQRAQARLHDPFVMHSLSKVRTLREWAAATRQIDLHFASDANRLRISRRAPFGPRVILPTG